MNTLSNVNSFWKAISEQMLDIRDQGAREKLSSLRQFSGLWMYLLRAKQMEIKITNLLFIALYLISFQGFWSMPVFFEKGNTFAV